MGGHGYIVTNRKNGVLYTGVTADIAQRIAQHREGTGSRFAAEHRALRRVYVEQHDEIEKAIIRESGSKGGIARGRSR